MNQKEYYDELNAISVFDKETQESILNITKTFADTFSSINSINNIKNEEANISKLISEFSNSLKEINYFKYSININNYIKQLANILNIISGISSELSSNIMNAIINNNVANIISSVNETISKNFIDMKDVLLLKETNLINQFNRQIVTPRGLKTSINELNLYSSNLLADNESIKYDTQNKGFTIINSKDSMILSSKGMNILCSTKTLFDDLYSEELFSEEELMNFVNYLDKNFGMALNSNVGVKIYEFIKNLNKRINFDKKVYYHARVRKIDEHPYTESQMSIAPTGTNNPGRFNHPGQSYFYFCDTKDGCIKEVNKHNSNTVVQIGELMPTKDISMIDLSGSIKHATTLLKYIRYKKGDEEVPKEYLLPCFISDCCREIGIEGIKYRGSSDYNNYVCWNNGYFVCTKMIEEKS